MFMIIVHYSFGYTPLKIYSVLTFWPFFVILVLVTKVPNSGSPEYPGDSDIKESTYNAGVWWFSC